jgi:hypothetical protein
MVRRSHVIAVITAHPGGHVTQRIDIGISVSRDRVVARRTEFFGGIWFKVFTERGPTLTSAL